MLTCNLINTISPGTSKEIQPIMHKTISLKLAGVTDKDFKDRLSQEIKYHFKRTGDFTLAIAYTGKLEKTGNDSLGKMEYNYKAGSITVSIEQEPCIAIGEIMLPATRENGLNKREIEEFQAQRMLKVLNEQMDMVSKRIITCMDDIID